MTLAPGTKRGSYEILSPLGAGGMGEVYRARDTRLRRDVAIKALPASLAADPERLARLEREARLLATLNHPNIAAIYGIEDSGDSRLLVLELVEGETLAERLAGGPLPVEDALQICSQIASGLEAAHDAGVIHRDLKPANVKIRPDGSVKILDLGLARGIETPTATDPSLSPTITSGGTAAGVILGTAAYMSPEQARGKALDKRSDVFSFGCVLYECLTGQRAFPGETVSDTLAAILRAEPDWSLLPANTPAAVRKHLHRCLEKDSKRRLRDIGDARLDIDEAIALPDVDTGAPVAMRPKRAPALLWLVGGALLGIVATFSAGRLFAPPVSRSSPPVRAVLPLPADTRLSFANRPAIAVPPDGRTVVFRGTSQGVARLYRRGLDSSAAEPITGTEGGFSPFFSPDGEWLGFFTTTELKKVPLAGGSPIRISLVAPVTAGAAWDAGGSIVFTLTANGPLSRIADTGGKLMVVSTLDSSRGEHSHLWPQILPEGRGILVTIVLGQDFQDVANSQIVVLDPKTSHRTVVLEGSSFARYAAGQIIFVRGGSVFRVPFDLTRLSVTGSPVPLAERIAIDSVHGSASFAITTDGMLVYADGPPIAAPQSVVIRLDRQGVEKPLPLPAAWYGDLRLSPDGKTLVLGKCDGPSCKLVLYDLQRNLLTPLTSDPGRFFNPVWSPDGRRLAYSGFAVGAPTLYVKNADGSGRAERLTDAPTEKREAAEFPNSWSPDGSTIAYIQVRMLTGGKPDRDVCVASSETKRPERRCLESPFAESAAAFSPDGHWMAYVSDESGRQEVYVRPFPAAGGRIKISSDGGSEPVWTRGGRELLYRQGNQFLSVEVRTEPGLAAGTPRLLFSGDFVPGGREDAPFGYTVSPDGNTIYAVREISVPEPGRLLAVVTNWLPAAGK
jgi:serine/threonine protein kinase/Tol biopolymer transport system component